MTNPPANRQAIGRTFFRTCSTYFDDADVRIRRGTSTLDAHLLNPLALSLEKLLLRLRREQSVLSLHKAPLNLDDHGVYYKLQIPETYEFQVRADGTFMPPTVRVYTAEERWRLATEYDDMLPVPSGISLGGDAIPCSSFFIFNEEGNGFQQEFRPGDVVFPNHLYLQVEGPDAGEHRIEIPIQGCTAPKVVSLVRRPPPAA